MANQPGPETWRNPMPPGFRWPDGVSAAACFTFDVDAESPVLFDFPEAVDWLDVMTHQAYGPRTGLPRILRLLDRRAIRATFFVPGFTAERWPDAIRAIRDAGHEIAHHGYLHESSRGASPAVQEARLVRGLDALDRVAGIRPIGYRAPMWAMSPVLPELLVKHGFRYDSGLMDADHPYRLAVRSSQSLSGSASQAPSSAPSLVELPLHWALDDWEAYAYLPEISGSGVIAAPTETLGRWTLELDALAAEGGLFVLTNHPFLSGRPSRAVALEQLMEHAQAIEGLWIATCAEVAEWVAGLDLSPVVHTRPTVPGLSQED